MSGASSLTATRGLYSRPLRVPPMRTVEASPSAAIWAMAAAQSSGVVVLEGGQVGDEHLRGDERGRGGDGRDAAAEHEDGDVAVAAHLARGFDHFVGALAEFGIGVFGYDEDHF